jgi:hypothetical protein
MKASKQNTAGMLICLLLSVGAWGWGALGFHGIDLVSEPFGPMMVLSRTILSLGMLTMAREFVRRQAVLAGQAIRVRVHGGQG